MTSSPFTVNVADLLGRDTPPRHEHLEASVDWGLELSEIRPDPPLAADITLTPLPGGILAKGTLRFVAEHSCRRCLSPYVDEVSQQVVGLFEDDPDEESYPIEGSEIDLEPFLRDEVLLAFPMLPECPEGCAAAPASPDSEEADAGEWRLEDSAQAEEVRRRLMAVVEDDDTP